MRLDYGVLNTDGVNRDKMLLPLSALTESVEHHIRNCLDAGAPIGLPLNISHDQCRSVGWSRSTGVLLTRDRSRQLGVFFMPQDEEDREQVSRLINGYMRRRHSAETAPYAEDLRTRIGDAGEGRLLFLVAEAAAASRPRVAADLYPQFFDPAGGLVDKDGLVDYRALLSQTEQVLPGVFHERTHRLLLFAHRFFRRSLSHLNSLNGYALRSFHQVSESVELNPRLRLDPDLVGHPDSVREPIELEWWRGPKFQDDISAIPSGVAEFKSSQSGRFYSDVDKTQIWWKAPETRVDATGAREVRTFEVEELIEEQSPGLRGEQFGCRYAHAEYDVASQTVSHFDGAIRAYDEIAYLARIDVAIDRAGKQAEYTKLFRLDGPLVPADWKRLLSDFYRGNRLIPEYLGELEDSDGEVDDAHLSDDDGRPARAIPALSALINFDFAKSDDVALEPRLEIDWVQAVGKHETPCVEVGPGALAKALQTFTDPTVTSAATYLDGEHNLSTITLGHDQPLSRAWRETAAAVADALAQEVAAGRVATVSLAIRWMREGLLTTLSFAGEGPRVATLLRDAVDLVTPEEPAEAWIEALRKALVAHAPALLAPVEWHRAAVNHGRLRVARAGGEVALALPEHLIAAAQAAVPDQGSSSELGNVDPARLGSPQPEG
ncbi:hypothetical protein [Phenylobacterium sp.]|uniref:hypothetical protein n=1 Tax=Phenylobacterium sp. TaxID=1871053 RepID=UPI0035674902